MSSPLRDHIWIWGHPTNCLIHAIHRESRVSPAEGVRYMGAANLYLNEYGEITYDKTKENELAKDVCRIGWCIDNAAKKPENVTEIVEYAKKYTNIKIGMFDDFFAPSNPENNYTNYTPELLASFREELHTAGIEMWVVIYTQNFDQLDRQTIVSFLKEFDGVSLWFWEEEEIANRFHERVEYYLSLSEGKKRQIGCYVYNFAENKEANAKLVAAQLEEERLMLKNGTIEGVILHTNAVFGLDPPFEAVETAKAWMDRYGDETIPV